MKIWISFWDADQEIFQNLFLTVPRSNYWVMSSVENCFKEIISNTCRSIFPTPPRLIGAVLIFFHVFSNFYFSCELVCDLLACFLKILISKSSRNIFSRTSDVCPWDNFMTHLGFYSYDDSLSCPMTSIGQMRGHLKFARRPSRSSQNHKQVQIQ